ncbi:hypothetical protein N0V93_007846 [Gnomoniopsis smithogilvyi]|uniref:lytic cellulose monooxygenase (C4-dehydrogenating) n=1 Tax=Gnomoniopsis smithogilvyi TaxID=1191159 RepID=A0A9W9CU75_9PEZI|nr:hypothetical protein N0V93_007846 [Gnomoniopsis smithogilvyi]
MKTSSAVIALGSLAGTALAHGGVLSYEIANPAATVKGFVPYNTAAGQSSAQREWDTYNPITDPTVATMACNANGAVGAQTATIAAGSKITAYWNNPWPHTLGPIITWMAAVSSSSATPSGNAWFKIDQAGLISGDLPTGTWGMGEMVTDNSSWTSTIPASLKPGTYLLRNEVIAIHTSNQPQFYMQCLQLTVTGSGTASPPSSALAAIPGVYKMSDPSIDIDVYSQSGVTTYTIPGPAPWTG